MSITYIGWFLGLYPLNVKANEQIRPKLFVVFLQNPGKKSGKFCLQKNRFLKFLCV